MTSKVPQRLCGSHSRIVISSEAQPVFSHWTKDLVSELNTTLATAGYTMLRSDFHRAFCELNEVAYKVRLALAERDRLEGLEACVVPPDSRFCSRLMEDYDNSDDEETASDETDDETDDETSVKRPTLLLGAASIGLQRETGDVRRLHAGRAEIEMVLKPRVFFPRSLDGRP